MPTGPFTPAQIHAKLTAGEATWQTPACPVGGTTWLPLRETTGIGPVPPPPTPGRPGGSGEADPKPAEAVAAPPADQRYWLLAGTEPAGPFTTAEVRARVAAGQATAQTPVRPVGGTGWVPLGEVPGLGTSEPRPPAARPVPPPLPPAPPAFHFLGGAVATDVPGFLRACRDYPYAAASQLAGGEFGPWLRAVGEPGLAALAEAARAHSPYATACLQYVLTHADPGHAPAASGHGEPASGPPRTADSRAAVVGVVAAAAVLGFTGWLLYQWLRPLIAAEVCRKFDGAKTAAEAKTYATARMHPLIDTLFAARPAAEPNDEFDLTQEVDGPDPDTKLVGFRGTWYDPEAARRVRVEGHLRVVRGDGWKVDDMVFTGVEGVALTGPVSLVDEYRQALAPKPTGPPSGGPGSRSVAAKPAGSTPRPSPVGTWYERNRRYVGLLVVGLLAVLGKAIRDGRKKSAPSAR